MTLLGRRCCRDWFGSIFKLKPDIVRSDDDGAKAWYESSRPIPKDGLSLARKTHAGGWVSNWTLYYMIARRCFRLSGSLLAAVLLAARRSARCSLLAARRCC